jgi:TRAP-type C4-dicarboxylate transport system permease small subunit
MARGEGAMSVLARVERAVNAVLRLAACVLLLAMCAAMALQVFQRFVVGRSLDWPDELAPTLLVWISFVGAALAARDNEHVGFPLLVDALPPALGAALRLAGTAVVVALLGVYVWFSGPLMVRTWDQTLTTVPISRGLLYGVLPVTSIVMIGYVGLHSPLGTRLRTRLGIRSPTFGRPESGPGAGR